LFLPHAGGATIQTSPHSLAYPSLDSPTSIAFHQAGLWIVSDTGNDRIVLLNQDLSVNATYEGVKRPRGVAVSSDGNIWISDGGNDRVVVLDPELNMVDTYGSSGSGRGEFHLPWGVDVDSSGRVAIADALNRRIHILGPGGGETQFGTWGTRPGEFDGPLDLAFDSKGRVLVVDTYLEEGGYVRRVQIFDRNLGHNSTIWDIENRLRFTRPVGIGVSETDLIAVADYLANRIYLFDEGGVHLGGVTRVDGQPALDSPYDVAFGRSPEGQTLLGMVEHGPGRVRLLKFGIGEPFALTCIVILLAVIGLGRISHSSFR
jgi:DNA-binding beta-propeller fold protein YncE